MNTAQTQAIAQADAELNNAALPTYSELLEALQHLLNFDRLGAHERADARSKARIAIAKATGK